MAKIKDEHFDFMAAAIKPCDTALRYVVPRLQPAVSTLKEKKS